MSDYFSKLLFSQKFITSGSSLDPGFSNNGSKKLRAGDDTSDSILRSFKRQVYQSFRRL